MKGREEGEGRDTGERGGVKERGTGVQVVSFEVLTSSYQLTPHAHIVLGCGSLIFFGQAGWKSPRFYPILVRLYAIANLILPVAVAMFAPCFPKVGVLSFSFRVVLMALIRSPTITGLAFGPRSKKRRSDKSPSITLSLWPPMVS